MQGIDNQQYARWVIAVGRSIRMSPADDSEWPICEQFYTMEVKVRPWLWTKFFSLSPRDQGLLTVNNEQAQGRLIEAIGRDMMKIPVIDAGEKAWIDELLWTTDNRRYGGQRIPGMIPGYNT